MNIFFWGNYKFSNCYFFQRPPLSEWVIYSVENFIKAWQAKRGIDLQFPVDRSTNIVSWLNYSHVWELDGNFIGEINTIHSAVQTHSDGLIINVNGLVFTTKLTVSSTETVNPDGDSHGQHGINKFIFTNDDELCLSAAWMVSLQCPCERESRHDDTDSPTVSLDLWGLTELGRARTSRVITVRRRRWSIPATSPRWGDETVHTTVDNLGVTSSHSTGDNLEGHLISIPQFWHGDWFALWDLLELSY